MAEQEQIIQDFKDKCAEILTKQTQVKAQSSEFANSAEKEITELADEIVNRHSNMPNIDIDKLKEDLYSAAKDYVSKY